MIVESEFCDLCGSFGAEWKKILYTEFEVCDTLICERCFCELERPEKKEGCCHCDSDQTAELTYFQVYDDIQAPVCEVCAETAVSGAEITQEARERARERYRELGIDCSCGGAGE